MITASANTLRNWTDDLPIRANTVCVLLIGHNGEVLFADRLTEKRTLLLKAKELGTAARLIAVWPGRYGTHAFDLPVDKLEDVKYTDGEFWKIKKGG